MVREEKLQEFYEAGRAMVTANFSGIEDAPGLSSDVAISRAVNLRELAKDIEIVNAGGSLTGLMGHTAIDGAQKQLSEKRAAEQKAARAATNQFLLLLEAQRQDLLGQLGDLQDRARDLSEQLADVERQMSETRDNIDSIDDAIEYRREHGKFELSADGTGLKDERLEALLAAYESEHGSIDRSNAEAIQDALDAVREREVIELRESEKEHTRIREELDLTYDEMDKVEREIEEIDDRLDNTADVETSGLGLISEELSKTDSDDLANEAANMFGDPSVMSANFNAAASGAEQFPNVADEQKPVQASDLPAIKPI